MSLEHVRLTPLPHRAQVHLAVTGRPDEMRVMWKTHSRSCPTKVHYGEGIMADCSADNAFLMNSLVGCIFSCALQPHLPCRIQGAIPKLGGSAAVRWPGGPGIMPPHYAGSHPSCRSASCAFRGFGPRGFIAYTGDAGLC